MPSKKTKTKAGSPSSGQWLYDFIMRPIEPDLLLSQEELDARYAGESPISHDARMEHYQKAFAEFDRVLEMITRTLAAETQQEKKKRRSSLGMQEQAAHSEETSAAEQSLDSFNQ